ncbi:MAG: 4-hydroxy-3-methylbut-2-enyl diphosphate reductase [Vicinamibacterales bacterium]|nr:4-hydroxy-3-methylbut-2-enyl diphosphate reductase [Vicinamibacterales bacterium]
MSTARHSTRWTRSRHASRKSRSRAASRRARASIHVSSVIFRKGLDLEEAVAATLAADYDSAIVDEMTSDGFRRIRGRLTVHLAKEFGFCYGVDRAVDYAYQTRKRFPDRLVYLTGEIIHNPHVNEKLRAAGIRFLSDPGERGQPPGPDAVVIIPAFGVTIKELAEYDRLGCTLVDTTCGSVLNVWKNVERYASDGFTALIHGKVHHEETRATASQTLKYPAGRFLVVLDLDQARRVCDYVRAGGDREAFLAEFHDAASDGFDPDSDLERIGLANQTTMLMSESLEISELCRQAMIERYGKASLDGHYRAFDTICSATQDRQDAVRGLLAQQRLDLMIVVGGYNSSNTRNLARMCSTHLPTYHVADAESLCSASQIRHRPVDAPLSNVALPRREQEVAADDWLARNGQLAVGLTAGASTPNNIIGQVVQRLEQFTSDTRSGPDSDPR